MRKIKRPLRVLVVEDDTALQDTLSDIISALGSDVSLDWALDVALAEQLIQNRPAESRYDLVICDISLPGPRDGLDLIAICQTGSFIPQIMISGMSEAEYLHRFEDSPCPPPLFVQKPFSPARLLELIRQVSHRLEETPSDA